MFFEDSIERVTLHWTRDDKNNNVTFFQDNLSTKYIITFLTNNLIRVRVWPTGEPVTTRTWAIVDEETDDVPYEGRVRHKDPIINNDTNDTCLFEVIEDEDQVILSTQNVTCKIHLHKPFSITWLINDEVLLQDNPVCSYQYYSSTQQLRHTLSRPSTDNHYHYYGLGEKSGPIDKKFRRYRMRNMDAMGYNAEHSDPLYKHIPFYITLRHDHAFGLFYDTSYDCTFDMGCEIDNYYGDMLYFETKDPDLDYYFINGPLIEHVIEQYTKLTGRCPLPPKWTLGYLGSAMKYTDAANAQTMLQKFIDKCSKYNIECTGFHLSSGYSMNSDDGKRYVFVWDKKRVPSPSTVTDNFHQAGMKVLANIKPAMLTTHPYFNECRSLFIQDGHKNQPDLAPFWGGLGAHFDFTNPDTVLWWQNQVTTKLLANGIDCTWNDNNEFNIRNSNAKCFNGKSIESMRPIQTILMVKASYDAQITANSQRRPWLLTRAACPGTQRYGGTWTGDNRCSWHTLKYNIPMGLNLSLSGFPLIGHDIGGFAGEKPSLELFVRWIQNGIFHPRFCVHSWRPNQDENSDDNNENALWMYEDALPLVHDALRFRKRLLPYLYSLQHEAMITGHPIIRPTVYHFQSDIKCRDQSFEFLLGPWLLIASVFEENAIHRTLYLPSGTKWYNFWTDEIYNGGQMITVPASLDIFPLFVREGALLPFEIDGNLEIRVYPFEENGVSEFNLYDDDGETMGYCNESKGIFDLQTIRLSCNQHQIRIETFVIDGEAKKIQWRLPTNEKRLHEINEG
jgi:alpha-glucosidase